RALVEPGSGIGGEPDGLLDQSVDRPEHRARRAHVLPVIVTGADAELRPAEIDRIARGYAAATEHRRAHGTERAREARTAFERGDAAADLARDCIAEGGEFLGQRRQLVDHRPADS